MSRLKVIAWMKKHDIVQMLTPWTRHVMCHEWYEKGLIIPRRSFWLVADGYEYDFNEFVDKFIVDHTFVFDYGYKYHIPFSTKQIAEGDFTTERKCMQ